MGIGSPFWSQSNQTFTQGDNSTTVSFSIGSVTNWTELSNATFAPPNPRIVVGTTSNNNPNPAVNVTAQSNGSYPLDFFGVGFTTYNLGSAQSGLFYPLSPGGGYSAILALDFQGIGLPKNLYNNFVSALNTITADANEAPVCQTSFAGGSCKLTQACSAYQSLFQTSSSIP